MGEGVMKNKSKYVIASLGFVTMLFTAGCTSESEPNQLDPTLMPPQTQVTAAPINPSDLPSSLPGSDPSTNPQEPVREIVVGEVYEQMPLPEKVPTGAVVYPTHDGKYLVVNPADEAYVSQVTDDTEQKISNIPVDDAGKDVSPMGLRGVWFQDMSTQMLNATGVTPVIVYSMNAPGSADSKENSTVWGYWVLQGDTITSSPFEATKEDATRAAQQWIDDQTEADAFVLISEG